jgi:hypothetical protein
MSGPLLVPEPDAALLLVRVLRRFGRELAVVVEEVVIR